MGKKNSYYVYCQSSNFRNFAPDLKGEHLSRAKKMSGKALPPY